jgi:hypothetical protein
MKKYAQIIFVFLIVIFSFRFYDARFIDKTFINYANFLFLLIVIVLSIPFCLPKRKAFVLPVQLIVFSIFFSILMAHFSWGQSFTECMIATVPYTVWIFFFYLLYIKIPVETIEKIIMIYGVLYVVLYFFQLAHGTKIIFGSSFGEDEFTIDRGIIRIIFPGGGIFVLASFLALNKLTDGGKRKWFWLLFSLLGILIPFLQVTRLFIAGVLLLYLYHILRRQSTYIRVITIVIFIGLVVFIGSSDLAIIKGLKEASATDEALGAKYIRLLVGKYFLTGFSPNIITQIFGNGAPSSRLTYYGKIMGGLNDKGYYLEDVGIIGLYVLYGILPIIAYIIIWYKSFTLKLPKQYYYVKYYLWYLLITCITTYYVYYIFYLISTVFALYIYQTVYEKQEKLLLINKLFKDVDFTYDTDGD